MSIAGNNNIINNIGDNAYSKPHINATVAIIIKHTINIVNVIIYTPPCFYTIIGKEYQKKYRGLHPCKTSISIFNFYSHHLLLIKYHINY